MTVKLLATAEVACAEPAGQQGWQGLRAKCRPACWRTRIWLQHGIAVVIKGDGLTLWLALMFRDLGNLRRCCRRDGVIKSADFGPGYVVSSRTQTFKTSPAGPAEVGSADPRGSLNPGRRFWFEP